MSSQVTTTLKTFEVNESATADAYVGAYGELVLNADTVTLGVHNGQSQGGFGVMPIYSKTAPLNVSLVDNEDHTLTLTNATGEEFEYDGQPKQATYTAATTLTVTHNLGYYPLVQFVKTSNGVVLTTPVVTHSSVNAFVVTTEDPETGIVVYY